MNEGYYTSDKDYRFPRANSYGPALFKRCMIPILLATQDKMLHTRYYLGGFSGLEQQKMCVDSCETVLSVEGPLFSETQSMGC